MRQFSGCSTLESMNSEEAMGLLVWGKESVEKKLGFERIDTGQFDDEF